MKLERCAKTLVNEDEKMMVSERAVLNKCFKLIKK